MRIVVVTNLPEDGAKKIQDAVLENLKAQGIRLDYLALIPLTLAHHMIGGIVFTRLAVRKR